MPRYHGCSGVNRTIHEGDCQETLGQTIAAAKANDGAVCGMQLMLQLGDELCIVGHGLLRRQELHVLLQRLLEGLGHPVVSVLCKDYEGPEGWGILPDKACGVKVPAWHRSFQDAGCHIACLRTQW